MGYHIINIVDDGLIHSYVESDVELVALDIKKDTIIYQGESHWIPEKVGNSEKYKLLAEEWYRAGIKAQELFKIQAKKENLILEELFQDQKSFKSYTNTAKSVSIKRGDFLIRNIGNLEIDIKCRNFYKSKSNGKLVFNFKVQHFYMHMHMMDFTKTPIVIAVYENVNSNPNPNSLLMFEIEWMKYDKLEVIDVKNVGKCFQVPVDKTVKGFELLNKFKA